MAEEKGKVTVTKEDGTESERSGGFREWTRLIGTEPNGITMVMWKAEKRAKDEKMAQKRKLTRRNKRRMK